jgi:hypothetical protein
MVYRYLPLFHALHNAPYQKLCREQRRGAVRT